MKSLDGTGLKRLHRLWRRRTDNHVALILDSVANPFNVGSILRSAAAFRVEHIWLAGSTESVEHAKTKKTALGSDRYLTFTTSATTEAAIAEARAQGYFVVGVELADGAVPLHTIAAHERVCLVLGHEERGLSAATMALCDAVAFIPLLGKIGSLNVATAAAIAIYEVRRFAWTGDEGATFDAE